MQGESKSIFKGNILFLLLVVINMSLGFILAGIHKIFNLDITEELSLIVTQLAILIPVVIYVLVTEKNFFKFIRFKKFNIWSAFLLVILVYCMWPIIAIINAISMLFATNMIQGTVNTIANNYGLLISVFLMAVVPAIVEESTFRGALLSSYKKYNPLVAVVFTAILFGLMHQNFNQMLYATAMGLIFGIVIEATDSIISTMIMHFIYNGTSVAMTYLLPKLYDALETLSKMQGIEYDATAAIEAANTEFTNADLLKTIGIMLPFAIIGLVLGILIINLIAKLNGIDKYLFGIIKRDKTDNIEVKQKKDIKDIIITYSPLVIGIIACLVVAVLYEIK